MLPPEIENVNLPNADEAVKLFKEKCIKVSGSDAAFEEASVSNEQRSLSQLLISIPDFPF